jgi:hypothetical protein
VKVFGEKAKKVQGRKVEARIEGSSNLNENGEEVEDDEGEDWEDDDEEMEDVPPFLCQESERPIRSETEVHEDGLTMFKRQVKGIKVGGLWRCPVDDCMSEEWQ